MTKLILNEEFMLYAFKDRTVYSSRQVAEEFRKEHKNILRTIDDITELKIEPSDDLIKLLAGQTIEQFCKENFFEDSYKDGSGKKNRQVLMTKKGSMLIVMGFTGRKATAIKIGLLNRFEAMEEFIYSLKSAKVEYPALTAALKEYKKDPKPHHFINEADMINRIVLGMSAKQFKDANSIIDKQSIRPFLSTEQIKGIEELQRADIGLLIAEIPFDQRKQILTQHFQRMNVKKIAA